MCPPPSDPIWPIGPTLGQVYVPRAEHAERVHRRRHHDDEGGRRGGRHGAHPEAEAPPEASVGLDDEQPDPGTYDDHGRATHREDEDPPEHRHVDAVA